MNAKQISVYFFVLGTLVATSAHADCWRHIYNNSSTTYTILTNDYNFLHNDTTNTNGHIAPDGEMAVVLGAGQTAAINFMGDGTGHVDYSTSGQYQQNTSFTYKNDSGCRVFSGNGNTWPIDLNRDGVGDTVYGDSAIYDDGQS